jgi:broad specificity phosphatase PhoE
VRAVTIYLIRHAHAGSRAAWHGDDDRRPLSETGRRQSEHLRRLLHDRPVGRLLTSPSRRCVETLAPLARTRGLDVEEAGELAEGADGRRALGLALRHAADHPALCSHGDVIPRILRMLHAKGMRSSEANVAAKGSLWVLDVDDGGSVLTGTYHEPLA